MKRLMAMILALAMVLSLAACAEKTTPTDPPKTTEAPKATEAPKTTEAPKETEAPTEEVKADPVYIDANAKEITGEINFYTVWAPEIGTGEMIEEFNKYYPNVKVNSTVYKNTEDGNIAADTAMMAGEVDVLLSFNLANTSRRWENGLLMDITDRLAADNLDLVTEWGTDAYRYKDRTYAFPSGGISLYVIINLDLWEKAGMGDLPTEWTWDEYFDACRKLTQKDAEGNTIYGGSDYNSTEYWFWPAYQVKGSNAFYKEDGTADLDNPIYAEIMTMWRDATEEGIIHPRALYVSDNVQSRVKFYQGKNATSIGVIEARPSYFTQYNPTFRVGFAPYPTMEKGQENYLIAPAPNSFLCISENTKYPEAAYAFAKFCATYGNKYMYVGGHAANWRGLDPMEAITVAYGSREEAEKLLDVDSYIKYVLGIGAEVSYSDTFVDGWATIFSTLREYITYVISDGMDVEDAIEEMQLEANDAIAEAKR